MSKLNNPIAIPKYSTREKRIKSIDGFSFKDLFTISNLATLLFVLLDFAVLYSRWDTMQTESWYFVGLIALSSAIILDVPMMLAGKSIVEYQNYLKNKNRMIVVVALSAIAFLLIFGFSIWFSYVARFETFKLSESATLTNNMAASNQNASSSGNPILVLVASLFSGVLPLGTSIASLVIALITYKPKEQKKKRLIASRVRAEEHLIHIRQGIAQSDAYIEYGNELIARETDLYHQFVDSVYAQGLIRKQAYREALEEKCSPDEISHIIETAAETNAKSSFDDDPDIEIKQYVPGDTSETYNLIDVKNNKCSA